MNASTTQTSIHESIRQLLGEYVASPFLNLRESGLQARLWTLLREKITPARVGVKLAQVKPTHRHDGEFSTSRVHLELKVGSAKRADIVIFRADRSVTLRCAPAGPTDVVATVDPEDVEAVIEIKAAPSRLDGQREMFAADIVKLEILRGKYPHIGLFFILVDKSICVPGTTTPFALRDDGWTDLLPSSLRLVGQADKGPCVEVWDLDDSDVPLPRMRSWR